MTGVVDVGGGMKGIFGAGVLDFCLDNGIMFDYCAGVSAGSANMASYICRQRGRNYRFYTQYAMRREYMSLHNLVKSKSFFDLDYVYGTLSSRDGEDPLDFDTMFANPARLLVVASNALTGKPEYFGRDDMSEEDVSIFKASSSLPVIGPPTVINEIPYYDGGITDPIPVQKALDDGCDRVVVILTRSRDFYRSAVDDVEYADTLKKHYPATAQALLMRFKTYNDELDLAKKYEAEGKVLIVSPFDGFGVTTATRDKFKLEALYNEGIRRAATIPAFIAEQTAKV